MSVSYRAVQWNPAKKAYDRRLAFAIAGYLAVFFIAAATAFETSPLILAMRAFGTGAIALLVFILSIGPLARFSPRVAPLLYNRRHLGVAMFLMALAHAVLATLWYHGFGVLEPLTSILTSGSPFEGVAQIPFQPLGLAALLILFAMAATSHDFWLRNLSPRVWKALHLGVYVAFTLLVAHVALGVLQDAVWPGFAWILAAATTWIVGIHIAAGVQEWRADRRSRMLTADGWVRVGEVNDVVAETAEGQAKAVLIDECRKVAVFRENDAFSAISGVCAHQGGPLGEAKVVDGCVTCPWHGYQYLASNGQSPPPFFEKIPTYELRIEGRTLYVHPQAKPPGTPLPPCRMELKDGGEA